MLDDYPLETLVPYIDWTPFFITWDLVGKYPKILDDEVVGEAAQNLFADAQKLLKDIIDNKRLTARAVFGLWPANTVNHDDIEVYAEMAIPPPLCTIFVSRFKSPAPVKNWPLWPTLLPQKSQVSLIILAPLR